MTEEAEQRRPAHDDEQALYTLLQSDYNIDEAVRRKQLQTTPPSGKYQQREVSFPDLLIKVVVIYLLEREHTIDGA